MMHLAHSSISWIFPFVLTLLFCGAALGVACMVKPDRFLKRLGGRRSAETTTDLSRKLLQTLGLLITLRCGYLIFNLLVDGISH
jgi:hypothetical protein